jgi:TonB family protein
VIGACADGAKEALVMVDRSTTRKALSVLRQGPAARDRGRFTEEVTMRDEALLRVLLRRPEPRFGLAAGLIIAVVLHLLAVPGASLLPTEPRRVQASPTSWGGLGARSIAQHVELVIRTPQETATTPPTPTPPEPEQVPKGQVVNLPAKEVERPDAADFLAEEDQRAERETRARITGLSETATRTATVADATADTPARDGASVTNPRVQSKTPPTVGGAPADGGGVDGDALSWDSALGGGPQALALLTPKREAVQGLKETDQGGRLRVREEQRALDGNARAFRLAMARFAPLQAPIGEGASGLGFSRRGGTGDDGLFGQRAPSDAEGSNRQVTGLPRADHLVVEEDSETALNTWRFKHATFFNRVADAIRRTWLGGDVMGQVDPDGRLYGREDRTTRVQITLDRDGDVVDLALTSPSGVIALDDEALRAIRAAGPFHNPPRALFGDGERFAFVFGFTIDFSKTSIDLNWAPY